MMTPVAVELWRGGRVESRHRVALAVVGVDGESVLAVGDVEHAVYPRSAIKPLQALPLVESGAVDRFSITDEELALACASHNGEPVHVEAVAAWLQRIGWDERVLVCGPHPPSNKAAADRLLLEQRTPRRIHNNCSGKHAGMVLLARALGAPLAGYAEPDHPVQQAVLQILRELTDNALSDAPGIDGCGVPSWPIPLRALAMAFARFVTPAVLPPRRAAAANRIIHAMQRHPQLVAGTGRCCTALLTALPHLIVKTGAGRVCSSPACRSAGWGWR